MSFTLVQFRCLKKGARNPALVSKSHWSSHKFVMDAESLNWCKKKKSTWIKLRPRLSKTPIITSVASCAWWYFCTVRLTLLQRFLIQWKEMGVKLNQFGCNSLHCMSDMRNLKKTVDQIFNSDVIWYQEIFLASKSNFVTVAEQRLRTWDMRQELFPLWTGSNSSGRAAPNKEFICFFPVPDGLKEKCRCGWFWVLVALGNRVLHLTVQTAVWLHPFRPRPSVSRKFTRFISLPSAGTHHTSIPGHK